MDPTAKEILEKDLLELMKLDRLPDEEKKKLYEQVLETIQNRLLLRLAGKLGEEKKEEFFKVIDEQDADKLNKYLFEQGIDYQALYAEEILLYKLEMTEKAKLVK